MSDIQIYKCGPRDTRKHIVRCIEQGLVPFVQSSPGIGKSSIMRSVANEFNLALIDHRLSTSAPEDLSGLPEFYTDSAGIRRARFVPFDIFPVVGTPIPKGKDGWMLFLDEANHGTKMVQAASYKLVLDRAVGQLPLHERVITTMAGNLTTDRAMVNPLSTAMQSRVVHIEMVVKHFDWLMDVAIPEDYDPRVMAYLNYKKESLMDFRADHQDKTFNCPRTWEFLNRLVKGRTITDDDTSLFAGTITSGEAVSFVQFTKVAGELVTLKDILSDPENCIVPRGMEGKWMAVSHVMREITDKNFGDLATYFNRYDLSFKVLFFRTALANHPSLRQHPKYAQAAAQVGRYLYGD